MHVRIAPAALTAALFAAPALSSPISWTDLVVFGDSLSDSGNFAPATPVTNGQTWAGQLGAAPGAPFNGVTLAPSGGTNFAYGGARAVENGDLVPDFGNQLNLFGAALGGGALTLGPDPLVVTWLGGNDLLDLVGEDDPFVTLAAVQDDIAAVVDEIVGGISILAAGGIGLDRFVVPGLPDFSQIPRYLGEVAQSVAGEATDFFNARLQQEIALLDAAPGLDVRYADVGALFDEIIADPAAFGFADASSTCEGGTVSCDGLVWFDDIHPTAATHALVAGLVTDVAAPIPLPAGLPLLALGLGALGLAARRRA